MEVLWLVRDKCHCKMRFCHQTGLRVGVGGTPKTVTLLKRLAAPGPMPPQAWNRNYNEYVIVPFKRVMCHEASLRNAFHSVKKSPEIQEIFTAEDCFYKWGGNGREYIF